MIIKIDHISLSSTDFQCATKDLLRLGYQKQFEERNVKNLQIKKPLLNAWSGNHDLALFSCGSNIPIELLNHRGIRDAESSFFLPIIRGSAKEMTKTGNAVRIGKQQGVLTTMGSFDCILLMGREKVFTLQELVVHTRDLSESESFWSCFGFRCVLTNSDYRVLQFVSPLQTNPCTLHLLRSSGPIRKTKLDDRGFSSLACISNDVDSERKALDRKNIQTTAIEQLTVHGKVFNICFVRGSQGEIVELLSLKPIPYERL